MKKVFAILLVLALVAGFAFADVTVNEGNHRLTVTSVVDEMVPQFTVYGSLTSLNDAKTAAAANAATNVGDSAEGSYDGTAKPGTDATAISIADQDISLYCVIKQTSAKDKEGVAHGATTDAARYDGTITFTITVGDLKRQIAEGDTTSIQYSVEGHLDSVDAADADTVTNSKNGTETNTSKNLIENTVSTTSSNVITAVYKGRVVNGQEIGSFRAYWLKDTTMPDGTYKADVTVNVDAQ